MKKLTMILALTAFLAIPAMVSAQGQGDAASISATATVIAQLEVSGEEDLRFGDVIPGIASTIAATDVGNAGRFQIQGGGNQEVSLSFDNLTELAATGGATLPFAFGSSSAGFGVSSGEADGTFDPLAGTDQRLDNGVLYVFVGGTVTPTAGQPAGSYEGQITLNVAYTGN